MFVENFKIQFMKSFKLLLPFLILVVACKKNNPQPTTTSNSSNTSGTTTNSNNIGYHPPTWIQGDWCDSLYSQVGNYTLGGYTFTSDDIISNNGATSSMKELFGSPKEETISTTMYYTKSSATNYGTTTTSSLYFVKVSSKVIRLYLSNPTLPNVQYRTLLKY